MAVQMRGRLARICLVHHHRCVIAQSSITILLFLISLVTCTPTHASSPPPSFPDHTLATWHLDPPSSPVDTSEGACARGVDLSSHAFVEDFSCLRKLGYEFAVVRAWQSDCTVDPTALETIENAQKAGMKEVHIYLYPSAKCLLSAAEQVEATFAAINSTFFTRAWLDVEPRGSGWSIDTTANEQYVRSALDAMARAIGVERVGVYSSFFGWPTVVGASTSGWSQYHLWYADPSDEPTWQEHHLSGGMGGWERGSAFMKQYKDQEKVCGLVVGLNSRHGENAQCVDQQQIAGLAPIPAYHPPSSMQEAQPQQRGAPAPAFQRPQASFSAQQNHPAQHIVADADGGIEFVDEPRPASFVPPPTARPASQWLEPSYTSSQQQPNPHIPTPSSPSPSMQAYVPQRTRQPAGAMQRKKMQHW